MNAQFRYEDGRGNITKQNSSIIEQVQVPISSSSVVEESESQDVAVQNEENATAEKGNGQKRNSRSVYSDEEKESFFKLKLEKCLSASAAAKQLGINARTAQRWSQEYDKDPDGVFDNKKRRIERKPTLQEVHKLFLQGYIDDNPSAVLDEVMNQMSAIFTGPKISKSSVYNFLTTECSISIKRAKIPQIGNVHPETIQQSYEWAIDMKQSFVDFLTNCVFLDETAFYINMRRSMAWSRKGNAGVANSSVTRAKATTLLGAISATRLIKISLGMPQLSKESMIDYQSAESNTVGVVAGHYLNFVKATLDEMDHHPEMKGHYLVMDNAPVHNSKEIGEYINSRGYQYIYLPSHPDNLNPMKQFWSLVKSNVKRSRFSGDDTIMTRIKESCDSLSSDDFQGFVQRSALCIEQIITRDL
ncbi:hypothetical protein G6F56_005024 [Rhizopus delemar]|nr:hypothetical protein G6F56_005024 [Rhizopus delemar]